MKTKRMSVIRWIALATLVFLTCVTEFDPLRAQAQAAPAAEAAPPAAAAPAAPSPEAAPAPVAEPAPLAAPAPEPPPPIAPVNVAPPADAPVAEPTPAADEDMKHVPMGIHLWGRVDGRLQSLTNPKKIDHLSSSGDLELHFDGNVTKEIGITGNLAAIYGPTAASGKPDIQGTAAILDLIARFDIADPFHIWAGRMLVPSDRANFSGTWFEAPWYYPGTFGSGFMGPREGPYGRNDGVTVWGQAEGGLFKYYASAFDLFDGPGSKPLWSGRLNLSLLNPEPGYYHSSTYYGKDILAIGIGGQYKQHGSTLTPMGATAPTMFDNAALFNADVLFEKVVPDAGVLDIEGAAYKYFGDYEHYKFSYLALASWLFPDKVGPGKIQPLVRWQSGKINAKSVVVPMGSKVLPGEPTENSLEAQIGYVISEYDARLALGYQWTDLGGAKGNGIYLGVQILK